MTEIRPVLSNKSKYHIEKHRYYELKHFCLQYPIWKKAERSIYALAESDMRNTKVQTSDHQNLLERCRRQAEPYIERMTLIEKCCEEADRELKDILLIGVTDGLTYDKLSVRYEVYVSRERYYTAYRRFFFILSNSQSLHLI